MDGHRTHDCRIKLTRTQAPRKHDSYSPNELIAGTTRGTFFAGLGLIDLNVAAFEVAFIEAFDGGICLGIARHLDEAEAFRLAGEFVGDHTDARHLTKLREGVFKIALGDAIRKIAYVYIHEAGSLKDALIEKGIEARNALRVRCRTGQLESLKYLQALSLISPCQQHTCDCHNPFNTRPLFLQAIKIRSHHREPRNNKTIKQLHDEYQKN